MPTITPRIFKGTRDFLPEEMIPREEIIDKLKTIFQKYGFQPLETPSIEFLDILTGKYGEDERLIYKLAYKGGNELALRYDLTVPLSRVIAMNPEVGRPFKRYQIQPVWRAEKPQLNQGRFREFYQCDADTIGSDSIFADVEFIIITDEILNELGFEGYKIRINSRKILKGIIEFLGINPKLEGSFLRSLDKLDKIGFEGVNDELSRTGFSSDVIDKINNILQISMEKDSRDVIDLLSEKIASVSSFRDGLDEVKTLFEYLEMTDIDKSNYKFDLYLARGLEYYTGIIYESVVSRLPHMGSLTGGGRYDKLIGTFAGKDIPATGTTIGLDRIFAAMKQLNILPEKKTRTQVLICNFGNEFIKNSIEAASVLRKEGFNTEVYYKDDKINKQFSYANKNGIPVVVIEGMDEIKEGKISIKNMIDRTQISVSKERLIDRVREIIEK
ncbi:histidine--tRNA ligase [candidate division KSB1 bacterium]